MTRAGRAMVALIALAAAACSSTPLIPDDAALPLVARTLLQGQMTPDVTEGVDPETLPRTPAGSACLQSITRPAGRMDLCWGAYRDPHDSDPTQDYYRFKVFGTIFGSVGSGVRWASVLAGLVGEPSNNVFLNWPRDVFDGPCQQVEVSLGIGPVEVEEICGRTTGNDGRAPWSYRVTWTCVECLVPDHENRALSLHQWIAVPQGRVPTWEIFADLGS